MEVVELLKFWKAVVFSMTLSLKSRWTRLGHLPTKVETSDLCRFFWYLLRFSSVMVSDTRATATCTRFSVKSAPREVQFIQSGTVAQQSLQDRFRESRTPRKV